MKFCVRKNNALQCTSNMLKCIWKLKDLKDLSFDVKQKCGLLQIKKEYLFDICSSWSTNLAMLAVL